MICLGTKNRHQELFDHSTWDVDLVLGCFRASEWHLVGEPRQDFKQSSKTFNQRLNTSYPMLGNIYLKSNILRRHLEWGTIYWGSGV